MIYTKQGCKYIRFTVHKKGQDCRANTKWNLFIPLARHDRDTDRECIVKPLHLTDCLKNCTSCTRINVKFDYYVRVRKSDFLTILFVSIESKTLVTCIIKKVKMNSLNIKYIVYYTLHTIKFKLFYY